MGLATRPRAVGLRAELDDEHDCEQCAHPQGHTGQTQARLVVEQIGAVSPTVVHRTLMIQK